MEKVSSIKFESPSFGKRIKGMLSVDFYRLLHTPLFYIFLAIAAIIPAMIIGTTGMEGSQTMALFTNVWQAIAVETLSVFFISTTETTKKNKARAVW